MTRSIQAARSTREARSTPGARSVQESPSTPGVSPRERASVAIAIGNWGIAPSFLLADEDSGVRACAALAPALDDDPAALDEIRLALRDPQTADSWFEGKPPQLDGRLRFALVEALLRRTTTFDFWFHKVGLPTRRDELRVFVADTTAPGAPN